MDQDAFHNTYSKLAGRACGFEKVLLSGRCRCSQAEKFCLAEREGIHCRNDDAQEQCAKTLEHLRAQSRFTLRLNDSNVALGHNKMLRIQMGGLIGIHIALYDDEPPQHGIDDINQLLSEAIERFETLEAMPNQLIIQNIAAFKVRKRSFGRRSTDD